MKDIGRSFSPFPALTTSAAIFHVQERCSAPGRWPPTPPKEEVLLEPDLAGKAAEVLRRGVMGGQAPNKRVRLRLRSPVCKARAPPVLVRPRGPVGYGTALGPTINRGNRTDSQSLPPALRIVHCATPCKSFCFLLLKKPPTGRRIVGNTISNNSS